MIWNYNHQILSSVRTWIYIVLHSSVSLVISPVLVHTCLVLSNLQIWRRQWHPTPVLLPGKSYGWRRGINEELGKLFWNKNRVCVCVCVYSVKRPQTSKGQTQHLLGVVAVAADPGNVDIEECKTLNNRSANTQRILGCWIITNSSVMGR